MAQKRATAKKSAARKSKKATTRTSKKAVTNKSKSSSNKRAQLAFDITTIKSISNYCSGNIEITNKERGQIVNIPPGETVPTNMDIPWADTLGEFRLKHLFIKEPPALGRRYYICQKNRRVSYQTSLEAFGSLARVPGYSEPDGDRVLVINSDGTFEIQRTGWLKPPTRE